MNFQHSSLLFALAWVTTAVAHAQPVRFQGDVAAGAAFRKEIGRGLVFLLRPAEGGWTIAVEPAPGLEASGCKDNFAGVIGVPLRGFREVYLSPAYNSTSQEAMALAP